MLDREAHASPSPLPPCFLCPPTRRYYTSLRVGYSSFDVTYGGSTGPGTVATRDAPFESVAVRLLFHDTTDWERQGLATRRMQVRGERAHAEEWGECSRR